jgi:hypothetical protein
MKAKRQLVIRISSTSDSEISSPGLRAPTLGSIWNRKLSAWEGRSRRSTPAAAPSCATGDAARRPAAARSAAHEEAGPAAASTAGGDGRRTRSRRRDGSGGGLMANLAGGLALAVLRPGSLQLQSCRALGLPQQLA